MSKLQIISDKNKKSSKIKSLLLKKIKFNHFKKENLIIVIGGDGNIEKKATAAESSSKYPSADAWHNVEIQKGKGQRDTEEWKGHRYNPVRGQYHVAG